MAECPEDPQTYRGLGCSPGLVSGPAKWASETVPGTIWVLDGPLQPAIVLAANSRGALGLLVSTGGLTSHGASVARELRLPVISGINALAKIVASQDCQFDGSTGIVTLINRRSHAS
jgi:pyruvate,water dikinase